MALNVVSDVYLKPGHSSRLQLYIQRLIFIFTWGSYMYPRELTCLHHLTLHLSSKSSCLPDFSSPEMVLLFDSGHILECLRYHFLPYLPQPISPSIPCLPTSQVFTNPGDISPVHHAVHARTRTTVASALMATYLSVSSISASSLP